MTFFPLNCFWHLNVCLSRFVKHIEILVVVPHFHHVDNGMNDKPSLLGLLQNAGKRFHVERVLIDPYLSVVLSLELFFKGGLVFLFL